MNIIIRNCLFYSVAYDNQKNILCRIKISLFGNRVSYIYDSDNKLRYITKILINKDTSKHRDNCKYQITKVDSGTKTIVGVADLDYLSLKEGNIEKEFYFRPPMINKLVLHLSSNNHKLRIYLKRDGSCFIKNEEDTIIGCIKKQKRYVSIDMKVDTLDIFLVCAIFELSRYLDAENEFVLV